MALMVAQQDCGSDSKVPEAEGLTFSTTGSGQLIRTGGDVFQ